MSDWIEGSIFAQIKEFMHEVDVLGFSIIGLLAAILVVGCVALYHFW